MLIDGEKYACEACVRGHRVSTCQHSGKLSSSPSLFESLAVGACWQWPKTDNLHTSTKRVARSHNAHTAEASARLVPRTYSANAEPNHTARTNATITKAWASSNQTQRPILMRKTTKPAVVAMEHGAPALWKRNTSTLCRKSSCLVYHQGDPQALENPVCSRPTRTTLWPSSRMDIISLYTSTTIRPTNADCPTRFLFPTVYLAMTQLAAQQTACR